MNLIWFLTIGTIVSTVIGEFGKYPFGTISTSVGVMDLLVALTLGFFVIWKIGIKKQIVIPKSFQLVTIFWVVGGLSLLLSGNLTGSLYLVRFILYSSFFLIGWTLIKDKQINLEDLTSKVVLAGVLLAGIGFIQLLVMPNLARLTLYGFDPHNNRLVSSFLDPNFTGTFLNICLVLAAHHYLKFKKKIWLICLLILFAAIILTYSRSAYLMFLIELIGIGLLKSKKILVLVIGILLILFLTIPQFNARIVGGLNLDSSASERLDSWQKGLLIFQQSPIFGVGFNNLRAVNLENNLIESFQDQEVHSGAGIDSSLIFILVTTGIIGLFVYLVWLFYLVRLFFNDSKNKDFSRLIIILLLALLVNSQFINSLFYPEIMIVYFGLLGASSAAARS